MKTSGRTFVLLVMKEFLGINIRTDWWHLKFPIKYILLLKGKSHITFINCLNVYVLMALIRKGTRELGDQCEPLPVQACVS